MTDSLAALKESLMETANRLSNALADAPVDDSDDYGPSSSRWRHQSLSKGAAGVAILHGIRAQDGLGSEDPVRAWLARATRDDLSAAPGAGLWFGAPAVAFALTVAAPGRYAAAASDLDANVRRLTRARLAAAHARLRARQRPALSEFDLVRGLTGLGAYLLHRDPGSELLSEVLAYLVRLTEPVAADDRLGQAAPGWWSLEQPTKHPRDSLTAGHANHGMAHGITGPLALLALAYRRGISVPGHAEAMERICHWLDYWRQETPQGPWWPEWITLTDLHTTRPAQHGPARPSWCYGTPGLARAQQLAGIALADPARQQAAEAALADCLSDAAQMSRLTDPAVCHGLAGVAAATWCAAADARTPVLDAHAALLANALIARATSLTCDTPGLIEGTAGVALTLHSLATGTTGGWMTSLLIN